MYRCTKINVQQKKKAGKQDHCKFSYRTCYLPALENYEYCSKHILEDKTAPYKVCSYIYPMNGKKCNQPAPKDRKEGGLCAEHSRKAQFIRQRAAGRHCPPQSVESLLSSLSHYAPNNLNVYGVEVKTEDNSNSNVVNPFVELDASKVNLCGSRVLDYVSESDSDVEPAVLETVWRDNDRDSSDAESVDSQQEDPLKHAGIYTAEEVALIVKEKMCRLQTLYLDQFKRLQHILKERKRKYYHTLLKEKEAVIKNNMTTVYEQSKTTPKEMKLYEKLKALNRFHKRSGEEGVLQMRVKDKRNQAKKMKKFRHKSRNLDGKNEGLTVNTAPTCKCIYTEGGVKCGLKTLPSCKYCRKHILEDNNQRLFRSCGCEKADILCQEPVLNIFQNTSCPLHVSFPAVPIVNIKDEKKEVADEDTGGGGDSINIEPVEPVATTSTADTTIVTSAIVSEPTCDPPVETCSDISNTIPTVGPGGDNTAQSAETVVPSVAETPSVAAASTPNEIKQSVNVMEEIIASVDVMKEVAHSEDSASATAASAVALAVGSEVASLPSIKGKMDTDNTLLQQNVNDSETLMEM